MHCVAAPICRLLFWFSGFRCGPTAWEDGRPAQSITDTRMRWVVFVIILRVAEISGRKTTVANLHSGRDLCAEPMHGNERQKNRKRAKKWIKTASFHPSECASSADADAAHPSDRLCLPKIVIFRLSELTFDLCFKIKGQWNNPLRISHSFPYRHKGIPFAHGFRRCVCWQPLVRATEKPENKRIYLKIYLLFAIK